MFNSLKEGFENIVGKRHHKSNTEPEGETHQELKPLEDELTTLVGQLEGFAGKNPTPHDLRPIRQRLGHIDSMYQEGRFNIPGVKGIPPGQARVADLLSRAHELLRARLEETDYYKVATELRSYHDRLVNMQHALDALKDKPDVKPKDVRSYRQKLAEIDAHYHEGRFEVHKSFPEGQAIVADLLAKTHDTVRELLLKTDYYNVDPALMSLHDRLENVVMGLEALKHKAYVSAADVDKYKHRLETVDTHYVEGKFVVDGEVPAGQAVMSELLEKAHALMQDLQQRAE